MSDWFVGQKIECVLQPQHDATDHGVETLPQLGYVYTIRAVWPPDEDGDIGVTLQEIVNQPLEYDNGVGELEFCHRYFRPLRTKGIEIFRKIAEDVTNGKVLEITDV